jgi:hypothetical protein
MAKSFEKLFRSVEKAKLFWAKLLKLLEQLFCP